MSFMLIFIFFSRPLSIDDLTKSLEPLRRKFNDKTNVKDVEDDSTEVETTSEVVKVEKPIGAEPKLLENILTAKYQPRRGGKSIFFIETNKIEDKVLALKNRQSCSIEAAILANPELDVFLLFSFEVGYFNKTPLPLVDNLLSYKNFHMAYFDIVKFAEKTPLGEWFASGEIYKSKFIINHISDIVRVLTLWKYTGGQVHSLEGHVFKPFKFRRNLFRF